MDGQWSFKVVGSYSPSPTDLQLDASQIQWTGQVSPVTKVSLYLYLYALWHFLALYNMTVQKIGSVCFFCLKERI